MTRPRAVNVLIGLGFFAALAISSFWLVWFAAPELVQARSPADPDYPLYVAFERACPLADAWLALTALLGAVGLCRMRPQGFLAMLLAGSAAIFLGLLDLLYDLEHGMFVPLSAGALIELAFVLLLLVLGPLVIGLSWQQRRFFA